MALPSSGPLSLNQIGSAIGTSTPNSLRSMSSTVGFSTPDAVSEFYGFGFTISWTNNNITTGTNVLTIFKNGSVIVNQSGLGSGNFTVVASDVIAYELSSTTPNFTIVQISDSVHGTISNCNYNSAYIGSGDVSYTSNASIDGTTTDDIFGCP
jgi:hypothetical protein